MLLFICNTNFRINNHLTDLHKKMIFPPFHLITFNILLFLFLISLAYNIILTYSHTQHSLIFLSSSLPLTLIHLYLSFSFLSLFLLHLLSSLHLFYTFSHTLLSLSLTFTVHFSLFLSLPLSSSLFLSLPLSLHRLHSFHPSSSLTPPPPPTPAGCADRRARGPRQDKGGGEGRGDDEMLKMNVG